jgi:hypothetical protein
MMGIIDSWKLRAVRLKEIDECVCGALNTTQQKYDNDEAQRAATYR